MAETILTQFAKVVVAELGSAIVGELKLALGLEDELDRIKSNMISIQAVLRDAEKQQSTSESVKAWLGKLQDVMYDIDDLLDDITTEFKLHAMNKRKWRRQVCKFFSRTNFLVLRWQWAHQVKSLSKTLDLIAFERTNFVLSINEIGDSEASSFWREIHSKLSKSDFILGREGEKEAIINSILNCRDCERLSVIPIVGFGGIGKTTLAQLIYNDPNIDDNFEKKLWVYVSEKFRIKNVMKQVISMATGENILQLSIEQLSLESLRIKMSSALKEKKYLLVLDDLWNEDSNEWRKLKELLDVGAKGSTVVVTTRDSKVASITHTVDECKLKELSYETSLQLFKQLAFTNDGKEIEPKLLNMASKIVKMSRGLPLLVTTLGKLLHGETSEEKWGRVILNLEKGHEEILNTLKLSYDQLTTHSKIYFRLFPILRKGARYVHLVELLPLCMSLGYMPSDGQEEAIGRECIEELSSKSLIMEDFDWDYPIKFDLLKRFHMHDLMQDLARAMVGEEFATINSSTKEVSEKVRFIAVDEDDLLKKQLQEGILDQAKKTRVLVINTPQQLSKTFLKNIISRFSFLRVLDLGSCQFDNLPRTIGYMKHLRYLNLRKNIRIRHLSNSICNLINLQNLDLSNCPNLQELPIDIGKLQNLKFLFVTTHQETLPEGIGNIKGLRYLGISMSPNLSFLPVSFNRLENLDLLLIIECDQLDLEHGSWSLEGFNRLHTLIISGLPKFQKLSIGIQYHSFTSLQNLFLYKCKNLIELGDWIKYFKCLKTIDLNSCPNLVRLSHTLFPLKNLEMFIINNCPKLSERCVPEKGEYWDLISYIPYIKLDRMIITDVTID